MIQAQIRDCSDFAGKSGQVDWNGLPFWLFNPKAPQGEWIMLGNPAWI